MQGEGPLVEARPFAGSPLRLRLTNTGTEKWPADVALTAGWEVTDRPYLAGPPSSVEPLDVTVPSLEPGESVVLTVELPQAPDGRAIAWIELRTALASLADEGSVALQLRSEGD
jgi:hypothetical protein